MIGSRSRRPNSESTVIRIQKMPALALVALLAAAMPAFAQAPVAPPRGIEKLEHIVVIYLENHSFDNLYGAFPGANGRAQAGAAAVQLDKAGEPYKALPPVFDPAKKQIDPRFPALARPSAPGK